MAKDEKDTKQNPSKDESPPEGKEASFDRRWLKGLKFRTAEPQKTTEDGRKKTKYIPKERSLTPEDVLSWKDYGDHVVIVTADGQKVTVEK